MKGLGAALWAEFLKARRSKVFLITLGIAFFIPCVMAFIMLVLKYPEIASKARAVAIKASVLGGRADWETYSGIIVQAISVGGLILFGFIASWVFGREYSDRTVKDLLALPVPRAAVVAAKFIIIALWCVLLSLIIFGAGIAFGSLVGLGGWSAELAFHGFINYALCAVLSIFLCPPTAFIASYGRGYLAPIGFIMGTLMLAQISGFVGFGAYFPWAVPALLSGAAGSGSVKITAASYIILFLTGAAGYALTTYWWRNSDQS